MADAFTKEAFSLLGVGVVVVTLRTYTRWTLVGIRQFMLDDYLMLLALVRIHMPSSWQSRFENTNRTTGRLRTRDGSRIFCRGDVPWQGK